MPEGSACRELVPLARLGDAQAAAGIDYSGSRSQAEMGVQVWVSFQGATVGLQEVLGSYMVEGQTRENF